MDAIQPHRDFSIDVGDRPAAHRPTYWAQALQCGYFHFDVSTSTQFSRGRLDVFSVGAVRVGRLEADPTRVHRRPSHARADGDDAYVVQIPGAAPLSLTQGRHTRLIEPGSFAMVSAADEYIYEQSDRSSVITLKLPARLLASRFPLAADYLNVPTPAGSATTRIFLDFLHSFCQHGPLVDQDAASTVTQHLLELFALSLSGGREHVSGSAVHAAHRRRALGLMERQFRNPDLRIADIAEAMRVSERYVQKIFAETGQSMTGLLRERRLAEARRLLDQRGAAALSITQVAFEAGFADVSYFCRVFRKETGMAPSDYARSARRPS